MKVKIGDICTLKSGTSLKEDILNESNGVPYIKVSDMNLVGNEKYIVRANSYADESISEKMLFPEGTVLFPKRGGAIGTNKKRIASKAVCADLNTMGIIPSDKIRPLYLYYYFQNIDFGTLYNGSSVPQINNTDIAPMEIDLIPLEEQDDIVTLLEKTDDIVRKRKEELSALDDLIKARFVELFGDTKYPAVPLIDTVKAGAGLSYGIVVPGDNVEEGIPMVRPSDFKNGQLDLSNVYKVAKEIESKYAKTRLIGDEILVQVIGQPGQVMLATTDCKGMNVTRNLAVIRPNHEMINRIYLKEYIEKEDSQQILLKNTKQSTLKQLPLNLLKQLEVEIPPIELQNQFADFVHQVDKSKFDS